MQKVCVSCSQLCGLPNSMTNGPRCEWYMMNIVQLRDVTEQDLPIFFEQQLDPGANHMAAFTAKNPSDRAAFMVKWTGILCDEAILKKTVLFGGQVAGHVMSFTAPWSGEDKGFANARGKEIEEVVMELRTNRKG